MKNLLCVSKACTPHIYLYHLFRNQFLLSLYAPMNKFYSFIACVFLIHQLHAQEDISLRLKKGASYCVFTNTTTTVTKTENGTVHQTIDNEKAGFCYKIIEDHDSVFLGETVFNYLSQDLQTPEGNSSFSSNDHYENVASTLLSRLVNKPFQVWLRNDYTWIKTKGLDSLVLHMYDDYKLPPDTKKYLDSVMLETIEDFTRNDAVLTAVLYSKN